MASVVRLVDNDLKGLRIFLATCTFPSYNGAGVNAGRTKSVVILENDRIIFPSFPKTAEFKKEVAMFLQKQLKNNSFVFQKNSGFF